VEDMLIAGSCSLDLRERVLRACEEGRRAAKEHTGGPVMLAGDLSVLDAVAAEHLDALLAGCAALVEERTGRRHSPTTLYRALQRLGWRRKKSRCTRPSRSVTMSRRTVRRGGRPSPPWPPTI
jgi:transposase